MAGPNLLFLFTDEQRYDTMGAYGNGRIQTPHLDRLASESVVFERTYVTQAVCTPSRSSIMTGLYPHTTGCTENNVPLPPDVPAMGEMLGADYAKGYFGKWHLGDEIFAQHGFEAWRSIEDMYREYYREGRDRSARSTYHGWLLDHGMSPANGTVFGRDETARMPEELSKPAYLAEEATGFLRENRDRPFALYVNFLEPHMPFFGPRDAQHDPHEVALPGNFDAPPTEAQPLKARLFCQAYRERGMSGLPLETEADWRRMIANYWGLCSLVDTHAGRILEALEAFGLSENTMVVYTSDHGDMMGSHRLIAKCVNFEEAIRVPMMVRLPGQREGRRVAAPVSQIDLAPTLLDLMGEPVPRHLQGRSLGSLVRGEAEAPADDVFIEWNGMNNGLGDVVGGVSLPESVLRQATREAAAAAIGDPVRTVVTQDGWKLNLSPLGEHELYDLGEDPLETTNLAGRAEMRERMEDLAGRIRTWQGRTGDTVALPPEGFTSAGR